jgi:hypothetical protein
LFFFSSGDLKDVDIGQNVQYAEWISRTCNFIVMSELCIGFKIKYVISHMPVRTYIYERGGDVMHKNNKHFHNTIWE